MGDWQAGLDRYLTKASYDYDFMEKVEAKGITEVDKETGITYPTYIDELECSACKCHIGWSSDGTFTEFWTNQTESTYLCDDCCDNDWK